MPKPKGENELPFHTATFEAVTPLALLKLPPTYKLVPATASVLTCPGIPTPNPDHELPFHTAMFDVFIPPALVKVPPTNKFVPETASPNI
jgi:hypothetical protein